MEEDGTQNRDQALEEEKHRLLEKAVLFAGKKREEKRSPLTQDIERQLWAASLELLSDRDVALAVVSVEGRFLRYFCHDLRDDVSLVEIAMCCNPLAFQFAGGTARGNKQLLMNILSRCPHVFEWATEALRSDREVVLEAVKCRGNSLRHASAELRSDREVVLTAVKQCGDSLEFASEDLRSCKDMARAAVASLGAIYKQVARFSRSTAFCGLSQNGSGLRFAANELREDRDFQLEMVKEDWSALFDSSEEFRGDLEVMIVAVRQSGLALRLATEELRGNRVLVLEAVKEWWGSLEFAHADLKVDKDFVLTAVRSCPDWNAAKLCYEKAAASLKQVFPWEVFCEVYMSKLAIPGQTVPVLSVSMSHSPTSDRGSRGHKRRCYDDYDDYDAFSHSSDDDADSRSPNRNAPCSETPSQNNSLQTLTNGSTTATTNDSSNPSSTSSTSCIEDSQKNSTNCSFSCEVSLLSGSKFEVEALGPAHGERARPTVGDLANILVEELPKKTEVTGANYIFITFVIGSDEFSSVTAWDWDRPLSDFLRQGG